jgi:UDP-GlcNAc:undecaprenyl-phosphate/decaprenyl-phosphate GlcNAc-1-phosphate transferase
MAKFILPFLMTFVLTVVLIILAIEISKKISWIGRKSSRHIRGGNISRMGGLVMIVVFNLAIYLNQDLAITPELYGFSLGTIIFLIIGFWDDLREIFWEIQLFIQVAVAVFVFIMGIRIYYITNPFSGGIIKLDSGIAVIFSVILVIFWIMLLINAINWSDGIDGLSSGITFIAATVIFFLSFRPEVNQPPIAIISAILMGTTLGFLVFNFYPSKIIAGTTGSMFMGFSLAVLAIFSGTKIATALLTLAIPIVDFLWVIGERIKNKKSVFLPDKNHLHYKLMELGWSQKKIVWIYWTITAFIAVVALNTRAIGKAATMAIVAVIMMVIIFFINKKIARLNKGKSS